MSPPPPPLFFLVATVHPQKYCSLPRDQGICLLKILAQTYAEIENTYTVMFSVAKKFFGPKFLPRPNGFPLQN